MPEVTHIAPMPSTAHLGIHDNAPPPPAETPPTPPPAQLHRAPSRPRGDTLTSRKLMNQFTAAQDNAPTDAAASQRTTPPPAAGAAHEPDATANSADHADGAHPPHPPHKPGSIFHSLQKSLEHALGKGAVDNIAGMRQTFSRLDELTEKLEAASAHHQKENTPASLKEKEMLEKEINKLTDDIVSAFEIMSRMLKRSNKAAVNAI